MEHKRIQKARKPKFIAQDSYKRKEVSSSWRKPRGLQSKMRLMWRNFGCIVKPGYRTPAELRGLTRDGLRPVMVSNTEQLKSIEEGMAALISGGVGQKKRAEIVKKADELGIKIINVKDAKAYLESVSTEMKARKEEKQKHTQAREKKKAEKAKKADAKSNENSADAAKEDDKKAEEKKEKDRILTKKEN